MDDIEGDILERLDQWLEVARKLGLEGCQIIREMTAEIVRLRTGLDNANAALAWIGGIQEVEVKPKPTSEFVKMVMEKHTHLRELYNAAWAECEAWREIGKRDEDGWNAYGGYAKLVGIGQANDHDALRAKGGERGA